MNWEKYEWKKKEDLGKITYYYCNKDRSNLPVRDVCNDHHEGPKKEPHYEDGTYNYCADCNAYLIDSMIKKKKANILFFATWYTGKKKDYQLPGRKYYITGYYRVNETKKIDKRYAVKSYSPFLAKIEDAFELTKILHKWRPHRKSENSIYGDQLKFYTRDHTVEILNHFKSKKNALDEYIAETERLKSEYRDAATTNQKKCKPTRCK